MTHQCAWDDQIHPMDKRKEYDAARNSRATAGQCGDFWTWLAEAYPRKKQASQVASSVKTENSPALVVDEPPADSYEKTGTRLDRTVKCAAGDFGWGAIIEELNAQRQGMRR